jgi:hypothetical protein
MADLLDSYGTCLRGVASVSAPFNLVVPTILGVLAVRNSKLACFCCIVAILTHVYGVLQNSDDAEMDDYNVLVLSLVRWLSEFIFAGFVCKLIYRVLFNDRDEAFHSGWYWVAALPFFLLRYWEECFTFTDLGVYYLSTRVMQALRASFQVDLVFNSRRITHDMDSNRAFHIFGFSSLILGQIVIGLFSNKVDFNTIIDAALQLYIMALVMKPISHFLGLNRPLNPGDRGRPEPENEFEAAADGAAGRPQIFRPVPIAENSDQDQETPLLDEPPPTPPDILPEGAEHDKKHTVQPDNLVAGTITSFPTSVPTTAELSVSGKNQQPSSPLLDYAIRPFPVVPYGDVLPSSGHEQTLERDEPSPVPDFNPPVALCTFETYPVQEASITAREEL